MKPYLHLWTACLIAVASQAQAASTSPISLQDLSNPHAVAPLHATRDMVHLPDFSAKSIESPMDRPVSFDIETVALNIEVNTNLSQISGTSSLGFISLRDGVSYITLDAVGMTIHQVTDASGQTLNTLYDDQVLTIDLGRPFHAKERGLVHVHYTSVNPQTLYVTGPDATNPNRMVAAYTFTQPLGSRYWFPCLDRPSAKAPTAVQVTVDDDFKVLSNGYLLGRSSPETGKTKFSYRLDHPVAPYLVSLAIGAYEEISLGTYRNGVPVTLWTPPAIREEATYETERTLDMLDSFSRFTGTDYPFGSYSQSVAQAWGGSMEHQTATTMGGMRVTGDRSGEGVVAHELAHQWFGDHVTCETWEDLWLNEGFASYLPMVFFADMQQTDSALGQFDWWRAGYFQETKYMARALSPTRISPNAIFDSHSYEKGALVIHLMRHLANQLPIVRGEPADSTFTAALRSYLATNGGGNVRHQDLQHALEVVTGQSWQRFFDQWVRSPGHPVLVANYQSQGNQLTLHIDQSQADRAENPWRLFQFPLEVELIMADGSSVIQTVELYAKHQSFAFDLGQPIIGINMDPRWLLPAEIDLSQPVQAWHNVLKASPIESSQVFAARQIASLHKAHPLPADILATLAASPSVFLRADMISELSTDSVHRDAITSLVQSLTNSNCACSYGEVAIERGKTWLAETASDAPSADDISSWYQSYDETNLSLAKRAIFDRLLDADRPGAQRFALTKLQDPRVTTSERMYLVTNLTRHITSESLDFVKQALASSSIYHLRTIASILQSQTSFDHPDIVPTLIDKAQNYRYVSGRISYIQLLALQASSTATVCPALEQIAIANADLPPEELKRVTTSIAATATALSCP